MVINVWFYSCYVPICAIFSNDKKKIISNKYDERKLFSMKATKNDDRNFKESNYCWKNGMLKVVISSLIIIIKKMMMILFIDLKLWRTRKKSKKKKLILVSTKLLPKLLLWLLQQSPVFKAKYNGFFFVFSLLNFIICTFFLILQYIPLSGIWKRSSPIFFQFSCSRFNEINIYMSIENLQCTKSKQSFSKLRWIHVREKFTLESNF